MTDRTDSADTIAALIEHLRAGQKQLEELLAAGPPSMTLPGAGTVPGIDSLPGIEALPGIEELAKHLPDMTQLAGIGQLPDLDQLAKLLPTPEQLATLLPDGQRVNQPWPWPVASTPTPWPAPQRTSPTSEPATSTEQGPARRRGPKGTGSAPGKAPTSSNRIAQRRASAYGPIGEPSTEAPDDDLPPIVPAPPDPGIDEDRYSGWLMPTFPGGAFEHGGNQGKSVGLDLDDETLRAIDEELDGPSEPASRGAGYTARTADQDGSDASAEAQSLSDQLLAATDALMRGGRP